LDDIGENRVNALATFLSFWTVFAAAAPGQVTQSPPTMAVHMDWQVVSPEAAICGARRVILGKDDWTLLASFDVTSRSVDAIFRGGDLTSLELDGEKITRAYRGQSPEFRSAAALSQGGWVATTHNNRTIAVVPGDLPGVLSIGETLRAPMRRSPAYVQVGPGMVDSSVRRTRPAEGIAELVYGLRGPTEFQPQGDWTGLASRSVSGAESFDIGGSLGAWMYLVGDKSFGIPNDFSRFVFPDVMISALWDGRPAALERGLIATISGDQFSNLRVPLYARPVAEVSSARVHMLSHPNGLIALDPSRARVVSAVTPLINTATSRGFILQSASYDNKRNILALLLNSAAGNSRVNERAQTGEVLIIIDLASQTARGWNCQLNTSGRVSRPSAFSGRQVTIRNAAALLPLPSFKTRFKEIERAGHRIGVWTVSVDSTKKVLVTARGGPTSSVDALVVDDLHFPLLRAGFAIVHIEYSGAASTAPDIATRLGIDRAGSISKDVELLAAFLDKDYPALPVSLDAVSFGAVIAPELTSRVARLERILLRAPFSHWTGLRRQGAPLADVNAAEWRDRLFIGFPVDDTGNDINQWAAEGRQRLCAWRGGKILIQLGERDDRVDAARWIATCSQSAEINVFPNRGHGVTNAPEAREQGVQFLLGGDTDETTP
jgi:hypothetical protein